MNTQESNDQDNSRTLSRADIARTFGVSERSVTTWVARGCPVTAQPGRPHRFNEEEVRAWREVTQASPSTALLKRSPSAKADFLRKVNEAKRVQIELEAERALKDLGLDAKILSAKSYEDYVSIDLEIGALLARGALAPARARAIQSVIADARQNTKAHHEGKPDEDVRPLILMSTEGATLVRAFEGIISDERRAMILEFVKSEAAIDLEEYPNVDLAAANRDEAENLDPSGL